MDDETIADPGQQERAVSDAPGGAGNGDSPSREEPTIFVRSLRIHEHAIAGVILGQAFADKYGPALGDDPELIAEVASILPTGGQIYLALFEGRPAGTASLRRRGDAAFGWNETSRMWQAINSRLGFLKTLRAFFIMSLMEGGGALDTQTGYVAGVGVLPKFQGRGVGTAMLERIDRDARAMGLKRLALHVVDSNVGARRLYERHGYRVARTSIRPLGRLIWSFGGSHYMVKQL